MVNMFSGNMMYGGQSGNIYANLHAKYDSVPTPSYGPHFYNNTSMTIIPREPIREVKGNIFIRMLKAIFI